MATAVSPSTPRTRRPAPRTLPIRRAPSADALYLQRTLTHHAKAEFLGFGAAVTNLKRHEAVARDFLDALRDRHLGQLDDRLHAVIDERHRGHFDLIALRTGEVIAHDLRGIAVRIVTETCPKCGLPLIAPVDGTCSETCARGILTADERRAVIDALNYEFHGRVRDDETPEQRTTRDQWFEAQRGWYEPGDPGRLDDLDFAVGGLPGIDWRSTWALRAELPRHTAVFSFIDGTAAMQNAYVDWFVVGDYRPVVESLLATVEGR